MKKITLTKQGLFKKETLKNLEENKIKGGGWSSGCTDGCTTLTFTYWNCSKANCSGDCPPTVPATTTINRIAASKPKNF